MGLFSDFLRDERAIEGMPIRLVIALVVGVAALAIMMGMLQGLNTDSLQKEEVSIDMSTPDNSYLKTTNKYDTVKIKVTDTAGDGVPKATVILKGDTAQLEGGTKVKTTDKKGVAKFSSVKPNLRADQETGTLDVKVKPPGNTNYQDNDIGSITVVKK